MNNNLPLWSPLFRKNPVTGDFEYKPFPRYPTWLVAWTAAEGGGGGGGGGSPLEWHGSMLSARFTAGAPEYFIDTDQVHNFTVFADTDETTFEQDITLAPHALGHLLIGIGTYVPDGGILEMFLDDISLSTVDFYDDPERKNISHLWFIPPEAVPTGGNLILKGVVTGKRELSTGYKCPLTYIYIRPAYELA